MECKPVSLELTYGLERLATYVQNVDSIYKVIWDKSGMTYGDLYLKNEEQFSKYNFELSSENYLFESFNRYEKNSEFC